MGHVCCWEWDATGIQVEENLGHVALFSETKDAWHHNYAGKTVASVCRLHDRMRSASAELWYRSTSAESLLVRGLPLG